MGWPEGPVPRRSSIPPARQALGVPVTDGGRLPGKALGLGEVKGLRTQCPFLLQGWKRLALLVQDLHSLCLSFPIWGKAYIALWKYLAYP